MGKITDFCKKNPIAAIVGGASLLALSAISSWLRSGTGTGGTIK